MSDKPIAFITALILAAPLCALCILGPAIVIGAVTGLFGWLLDVVWLPLIAVVFLASSLGYRAYKRRGGSVGG